MTVMASAGRRSLPAAGLLAAIAASTLAGCFPSTHNVRAARAYSNEQADPGVVADRVGELTRALALTDELLLSTPYTPGDAWVAELMLRGDVADAMEDAIEDAPPYSGDYEVPVLKLYRLHTERVIQRARGARAEPARYPGIIDAMAELAPAASTLRRDWEALAKARAELAAASLEADRVAWQLRGRRGGADLARVAAAGSAVATAEQAVARARAALAASAAALRVIDPRKGSDAAVAREALAATSIALRLALEGVAVAPYAVKQSRRVERPDLADAAERARGDLEYQRTLLGPLADGLSGAAGVAVSDSAGFGVSESLIVQAVGVNWDATHLHLKGDFELLFFHQLASANASGSSNDYTGRTRRLSYDIDPVAMVGGRVIAAYDWLHVKNAASVNAGFKTDRLFSSGGDIENDNSLGGLLGLKGLVSDVFDIGAGLLGFRASVKVARFTSGEVSEVAVDETTGADAGVIERAPFQLTYTQIDAGYDVSLFAPDLAEQYSVEDFLIGFRYMSYRLPRIFYELAERTPGDDSVYVLDRQSAPQTTESRFFMGGLTVRFGDGSWHRLTPFGDVGIYGGGGPIDLHFPRDPALPDSASNRDDRSATMLALDGAATLGLRLRLTPRRGRLRAVAELDYHAEIVGQGIVSEIYAVETADGTSYTVGKKIDVGGFDLFHGPRLRLVAVF